MKLRELKELINESYLISIPELSHTISDSDKTISEFLDRNVIKIYHNNLHELVIEIDKEVMTVRQYVNMLKDCECLELFIVTKKGGRSKINQFIIDILGDMKINHYVSDIVNDENNPVKMRIDLFIEE